MEEEGSGHTTATSIPGPVTRRMRVPSDGAGLAGVGFFVGCERTGDGVEPSSPPVLRNGHGNPTHVVGDERGQRWPTRTRNGANPVRLDCNTSKADAEPEPPKG
jgi:hypothetical protein